MEYQPPKPKPTEEPKKLLSEAETESKEPPIERLPGNTSMLLATYEGDIVETIDSVELLPHLDIVLTQDNKEYIRELAPQSRRLANKELLRILQSRYSDEAMFAFIRALRLQKYDSLVTRIWSEENQFRLIIHQLMSVLEPGVRQTLCQHFDVSFKAEVLSSS